jgi:hypothetical protein
LAGWDRNSLEREDSWRNSMSMWFVIASRIDCERIVVSD